eukprot:gene3333-3656_t
MSEDALFGRTFDILRRTLLVDERSNCDDLKDLERQLAAQVQALAAEKAGGDLQEVLRKKKMVTDRYSKLISVYENALVEITSGRKAYEGKALVFALAQRQRLQAQKATAERRLQELVLEMIGEYGKSLVRAWRREQRLSTSRHDQLTWCTQRLRWQRFTTRLSYDLSQRCGSMQQQERGRIVLEQLLPADHGAEVQRLTKRLAQRVGLLADEPLALQAAVRVSRLGPRMATTTQIFHLAQTREELELALQGLVEGLTGGRVTKSSQTPIASRRPLWKQALRDLITNESIEYSHPPSFCGSLWRQLVDEDDLFHSMHGSQSYSRRLFFCLEERYLLRRVGLLQPESDPSQAQDLLEALQEVYVDTSTLSDPSASLRDLREIFANHPLFVVSTDLTLHQTLPSYQNDGLRTFSPVPHGSSPLSTLLKSFPSVVLVRSAHDARLQWHLAPACLANLIESLRLSLQLFNLAWLPSSPSPSSATSLLPSTTTLSAHIESCLNACVSTQTRAEKMTTHLPIPPNLPLKLALPICSDLLALLASHYRVSGCLSSDETCQSWSSLSLLPDRATSRFHVTGTDQDFPRLLHRYVVMESDSTSGPSCCYLLQLFPTSLSTSVSREDEQVQQAVRRDYEASGYEPIVVHPQSPSSSNAMVEREISPRPRGNGSSKSNGMGASSPRPVRSTRLLGSWDSTVLSNLCLWRSCCASATLSSGANASDSSLCSYHRQLKSFLDFRLQPRGTKTNSESSKYLPRAGALQRASELPSNKRDLFSIRAASTLMQELWDGRLQQTLSLFRGKVAQEIRLRGQLQSRLSNKQTALWVEGLLRLRGLQDSHALFQPATWSIWRNEELFVRMMARQEDSLALLKAILESEREARAAIGGLRNLHVFPAQEVAIVRKDLRQLRDRQEAVLSEHGENETEEMESRGQKVTKGLSVDPVSETYDPLLVLLREELLLCEKKVSLLHDRRIGEEELRVQQSKRLARLRLIEETQARDPANFRNQSLRF